MSKLRKELTAFKREILQEFIDRLEEGQRTKLFCICGGTNALDLPDSRLEDAIALCDRTVHHNQKKDVTMNRATERELPRYRSHKIVQALKIKKLMRHMANTHATNGPTSATIYPEEEGYDPFVVSQEYMLKHKPQVGGYYVVYKDDYRSFSPAKVFEEGYTLIE